MPSISVAMCTYNGEHLAGDQLESILGQARRPDEMVICDDGSKDDTARILREFVRRAPFPVKLIVNRVNLGATDNYQQAMRLCEGDLIAFADQDDVWLPAKLEKAEAAFRERPALGAVFSDAHVVDERLRPLGYTLWQSIRFNARERCMVRNGRSLDVLLKYNVASGSTMVLNSALYRDLVLPIPSQCHGDHWAAIICAAIGQLGMVEEPLNNYRRHSAQLVGPRGDGSLLGIISGEARKYLKTGSYLQEFRHSRRLELGREKMLYALAYDRLKKAGVLSGRPEVMKKFEEKLAHIESRRRMGVTGHFRRFGPLLAEIRNSGYRHYSNGLSYMIGDLLV